MSSIEQSLSQESASVLNRSMAEAARRSHSKTTPTHVASTILAIPSGLLRQACARSHPNFFHPLQHDPLELCFTIALDRLPTVNSSGGHKRGYNSSAYPAMSNALLMAFKRAQVLQRQGVPKLQQHRRLHTKLEIEQLIISLLDDPSVCRVMLEAGFSSRAVKATMQKTFSSSLSKKKLVNSTAKLCPQIPRNIYVNTQSQHLPACSVNIGNDLPRKVVMQAVMDNMVIAKKFNKVAVSNSGLAAEKNQNYGGIFSQFKEENKMSSNNCGLQLELSIGTGKRSAECISNDDRPSKRWEELSERECNL